MSEVQQKNELVSLNLNLPAPAVVAEQVNEAFKTIYTKIEEEIAKLVPDVTTKKGREEIASLAYKIARTKTGLDEAAAAVTKDQKDIIDAVNAERKQMREDLDGLKSSVRAPLDAWEDAETERKKRVESAAKYLNAVHLYHDAEEATASVVQLDYLAVKDQEFTAEKYGDDAAMINDLKSLALDRLHNLYMAKVKAEQEAAELEQLRREKAEREAAEAEKLAEEKRKLEEQQAAENAEKERQRLADEARAQAESDAAEKIAAAEQATKDAEAREKAAEERRQREADEAEARRVKDLEDAAERQRQAEEQAAERERQKIVAEQAAIERERLSKEKADQERAADLAHRKKLNGEAAAALERVCGLTTAEAQAVVIAIYKQQIPHVAISY